MSSEVRVYVVGEDLTQEEHDRIVDVLAEWFREYRPKRNAREAAAHTVACCLKGVKLKDTSTAWPRMQQAPLASRIRAAASYDIVTWEPIRAGEGDPEVVRKRETKRLLDKGARRKIADDPGYPKQYKDPAQAEYGDNPLTFFTPTEIKRREKLEHAYLRDFPQLDSVASRAKLNMLLDLNLLMDRLRFRAAKEDKFKDIEYQLQSITKQIVELEKALNIHPDQLAKQQKEKEGGTIGDAVRRFEEANPIELRERWFAEELLLLFQMYHTPSPRQNMGGYQLDEVGLFGMTRCRTCACGHCGERNYAGLKMGEIEEWLFGKSYLKRAALPVLEGTPVAYAEDEDNAGD